jgi:hypothetical protein
MIASGTEAARSCCVIPSLAANALAVTINKLPHVGCIPVEAKKPRLNIS